MSDGDAVHLRGWKRGGVGRGRRERGGGVGRGRRERGEGVGIYHQLSVERFSLKPLLYLNNPVSGLKDLIGWSTGASLYICVDGFEVIAESWTCVCVCVC